MEPELRLTSQPFAESGLPKLQFLGDSITVLATEAINARYRDVYDVAIEASAGGDTFTEAWKVDAAAALAPDIVVINFGTNDALRTETPQWATVFGERNMIEPVQELDQITGRLDAFAAAFPSATRVVFVTANSHNPSWFPEIVRAINRHLKDRFPPVVDWDAAWDPSYFDEADDPHPNSTGQVALVALVDEVIRGGSSGPTGPSENR